MKKESYVNGESFAFFEASVRKNHRGSQRKGQYAFNLLYAARPVLADLIRATELDPFYDDSRLEAFMGHVSELWDSNFVVVDEDALRTIRRAAEHWAEYLEENDRDDEAAAIDEAELKLAATVVPTAICSNCGRCNPTDRTHCLRCNDEIEDFEEGEE